MTSVLVCGGAGYIGSHMARLLLESDVDVVVLDDFSTGNIQSVPNEIVVEGDVGNAESLDSLFRGHDFDAVMHFCASSLVEESVSKPLAYYKNNVANALTLLETMVRYDVGRFVFSSTAAVYGHPEEPVITEQHPTRPINPYGQSKLMVERILADMAEAYGLRAVALRYFNAAGAHPDGRIGESHRPETHLIPNILKSVRGDGPGLRVFGQDYDTPDGTCVRDYVHVDDLARAHLLSLEWLEQHPGFTVFNLGSGAGFSVLEIIEAARRITGLPILFEIEERRPGGGCQASCRLFHV